MHENLIRMQNEALTELAVAAHANALEVWRVRYLSRRGGALTTAMGVLGTLPREERPGLRPGGQSRWSRPHSKRPLLSGRMG